MLCPLVGVRHFHLCGALFKPAFRYASYRAVQTASARRSPRLSRSRSTLSARAAAAAPPVERGQADFKHLGVNQELLTGLLEHKLVTPSEIQAAAIPEILQGKDVLLASHTGSGKTLAYLLPLIQLLKDEEAKLGVQTRPNRPRALILGPTRELADQILRVAKSLSHYARFRSACVTGGGVLGKQSKMLAQPQDMVIATPQRIAQHADKGNLFFGDVRWLVLDEADTMCDAGFGPEVQRVLRPLRRRGEGSFQCVLVAATLSKSIRKLLKEEFPGMLQVETKSLHKGVKTTRHNFLPVPSGIDKIEMLAQTAEGEVRRKRRTMIFCSSVDSCRAVEHALRERGLPTLCYHGDVPVEERGRAMQEFSGVEDNERDPLANADIHAGLENIVVHGANVARSGNGRKAAQTLSLQLEEEAEEVPLLVCSDLAARGLDIPGKVEHIINFDFPHSSIDYIHRSGRTGRFGAKGLVTSLVTKRDQVLASRIEDALQHGRSLDELSSVASEVPPHLRVKPETLQRKSAERKAEAAARKGTRGEARQKLTDPQKGPGKHPGQGPMEGSSGKGGKWAAKGQGSSSSSSERGRGSSSRGGFSAGRGRGRTSGGRGGSSPDGRAGGGRRGSSGGFSRGGSRGSSRGSARGALAQGSKGGLQGSLGPSSGRGPKRRHVTQKFK